MEIGELKEGPDRPSHKGGHRQLRVLPPRSPEAAYKPPQSVCPFVKARRLGHSQVTYSTPAESDPQRGRCGCPWEAVAALREGNRVYRGCTLRELRTAWPSGFHFC